MEREFLDSEVMAIIPVYKAGMGDISKIYLKSKEEFEVNKNVKSLIKKMARNRCVDLNASNKKYKKLLNLGKNLPQVLNSNMIFIPFKVRLPFAKNDGSMGFFLYDCIEKFEENHLIMKGNVKISVISCTKGYHNGMFRGYLIKKHLSEEYDKKRVYFEDLSLKIAELNSIVSSIVEEKIWN